MLNINYDKKFDVLYLNFCESKSYGDETIDGIVILRSVENDSITGVTIFNFDKRLNNNYTCLYNRCLDTLYIDIKQHGKTYSEEKYEGVLFNYDRNTNEIIGFDIIGFMKRTKKLNIVSYKEALKDVIPIDWSEDVLSGKKKVIVSCKKED
jgi:uncharacterized protein YuzE